MNNNSSNMNLNELMAKLESDNKIIAELDCKIKQLSQATIKPFNSADQFSTSNNNNNNRDTDIRIPPSSNITHHHDINQHLQQQQHHLHQQQFSLPLDRVPIASSRAQSSVGQQLLQQQFDDIRQVEDTVDSIEIPGRGRCKVYMAKYSYDPFKQSPNDNPDAELAFVAGEYILAFEEIDEDGFFIGELMDGRRGYVPSNWLDRLTGEDLFDFQATILFGQHGDDDSEGASYPPEFYDAILNDTISHTNFQHLLAPEDFHRMNDYVDLDDVTEIDDECLSDYERAEAEQMRKAVAPPQRLMLERQLNKSILIGWLHPQAAKGTIVSYQIYVDGVLKSTVPSGDRTKALLEGVDSNIPHRISVRAIDHHGRHSNDAGCTIVIGKNIPFAPSCVKASHITSDSALISWLPCNSNFHHVVAVNSVEVQTVRPGTYKHLINGLSANTLYRVWVRAKPGKLLAIDEKNPKKLESLTTYVDFRTVPKSLPDPPVNVQVEAGPQQKTLLVTWLPLTLNNYGTSNGCAVTGYAVFAGHKKLADIDSPTGDHALLDLVDLESLHKKSVTVRTKSGENLSQDSMPCQIPDEYLKSNCKSKMDPQQRTMKQPVHSDYRQSALRHPASINRSNSVQRSSSFKYTGSNIVGHPESRGITRSMQNLESDDSRSSIPMIEITKEMSNDLLNHNESYSEEEFENSMRLKGVRHGRLNRYNPEARNRSRQSHSVDSSYNAQNRLRKLYKAKSSSIDKDMLRYFVALFDYDPTTMSPNPDAASEELAFREGTVIKVYGDKGVDGFYRGELDGRMGYVPCNVVSEIPDPNVRPGTVDKQQIVNPNFVSNTNLVRGRPNLSQSQTPANPVMTQQQLPASSVSAPIEQWQQQAEQINVKKMIALYDYDPQENSPNADTESEISFRVGDVIIVYGRMDTDGFYMGELERTKQRGLVPSNFLREEPMTLAQQQQLIQQQQQKMVSLRTDVPGRYQQQRLQQHQQQQGAIVSPMPNQGGGMNAYNQQSYNSNQYDRSTVIPTNVQQQQQLSNRQLAQTFQAQPSLVNINSNQLNLKTGVPRIDDNSSMSSQMNHDMMDIVNQQNNSINRPTTLNLSANGLSSNNQGDWSVQGGTIINQTTNQSLINNSNIQSQARYGSSATNIATGSYNIPGVQINNQKAPIASQMTLQQQQQQQQHNQQQAGGMLSNLLTSGKQIIEAATTPRNPNQPTQFPSNVSGTYNTLGNQPFVSHYSSSSGQQTQPQPQPQIQPQQQASSHYSQQSISQFNSMRGGTLVGEQAYNNTLDMYGNTQGGLGTNQQGGTILNTMKNFISKL